VTRILKKITAALLLTAFAVYLFLLGALFIFQRDMMYHPKQQTVDPARTAAPEMQVVRVETADGFRPLAWYAPPPVKGRPVVLLFHGNAGAVHFHARRARMLLDAGYGVMLAGYRYNAGAGGTPSEEGLLADGRAAFEFLRGRGVPEGRVVVYGESLGSGVAVAMAVEFGVGGVILDMPYSSIADLAQDQYWMFPVRWLVLDRFESEARIGKVRAPIMIIHGEADTLIPVKFARKLYEAAPEPKEGHFIPGGTHGNLYRLGAGRLVLDFLGRRVAGAPGSAG
jgi:fermentation-respiration switch protein FrsA (DUF1100 family)